MWFVKRKRASSYDDYETWIGCGIVPTLNSFDNSGEAYATVLIIDGTRVDDVRVYESETMQTVISRWGTGGGNVPAIYPIQDGRDIDKKQNGLGVGNDLDPAYTLNSVDAQAVAYDEYNDSISSTHHTLRAGTKQSTGAMVNHVVRRLTPIECERLQGFPDNWTDEVSNSQRYKQMGNAVTVNVIEWIGKRIMEQYELR